MMFTRPRLCQKILMVVCEEDEVDLIESSRFLRTVVGLERVETGLDSKVGLDRRCRGS